MKKEKPTTKTCKHCKTEISYDAKACPNCGKKQGGGCLIPIIIIIVIIALFGALGSGGDETSEKEETSVETTEGTAEETTVAPSEESIQEAIEMDKTIFGLVQSSEDTTKLLLQTIADAESGAVTTLDVYDFAKKVETAQYTFSSQMPDKDGTNDEYIESAKNYILNGMMIASKMQDYLDKNKLDDLSDFKHRVEIQQNYALSVVSERMTYLLNAGVPQEKIDEILGVDTETE